MDLEQHAMNVDPYKARDLWREYHARKATATEMDREIARIYHAIGRGEVVIDAYKAIADAGVDAQGLPKLALIRADAKHCHVEMKGTVAEMSSSGWTRKNAKPGSRHRVGGFPRQDWGAPVLYATAAVPFIPPKHRPSPGTLSEYEILWEAEWKVIPPGDPVLLRRIGKSRAWIVVAAWDLTPVEQAMMAARM